jgi:Ni/Fe-hydrogenase subunit HybB-like protein
MHSEPIHIDKQEVISNGPLRPSTMLQSTLLLFVGVGIVSFVLSFLSYGASRAWAAYFVSLVFFMGLAAGSVILSCIFQITRAHWAPPVRRLAEANAAFLPVAWFLLFLSQFGQESLFPWAQIPRPGSEFWMNSSWTYVRILSLLGVLFLFMLYFVRLSIQGDLALAAEDKEHGPGWTAGIRNLLRGGFQPTDEAIRRQQRLMSCLAPAVVAVYAVFYSFFAFEMIMAMDKSFISNLFGAFIFVGNVYVSWAVLALLTLWHSQRSDAFARTIGFQQLWDLGKLTFGFCMLWGYFFFSQFLPIWYGNLPEETQWLIIRTREFPWKPFAYVVFGCCFIVPFIVLLSREVKRTPVLYSTICLVICSGVWMQDYLLVMPQFYPDTLPVFSIGFLFDLGIFLGFLGMFGYVTQKFLAELPFSPISSPLCEGDHNW